MGNYIGKIPNFQGSAGRKPTALNYGLLLPAKFHPDWCKVSPPWGTK